MKNEHKYPATYELQEILGSIANRKFLNEFAQHQGIFITHADQNLLAKELANLFFDEKDLEIIRKEAYKENHSHTLSGFVIKSEDRKFSLYNLYEGLRKHGQFDKGIILNKLIKMDSNEQFDYKGSFEYTKKRPGRIEFLQDETSSFDFYLKDLKKGTWQVEVDCNKSTDTKAIRELFVKNLRMDVHKLELIDQDLLSDELTITFFDKLASCGMDQNWTFTDIKHLTVKRGKDNNNDEIESEDEEEYDTKEIAEENLTGISQAILDGKNLREDPFVKSCEKDGYRFTAMTYEFEHVSKPTVVAIRAEFKGRPKVFEVGISNIQEKTGLSAIKHQSTLSSSENRIIRSNFWNNAKSTFDSILKFPYSSKRLIHKNKKKIKTA